MSSLDDYLKKNYGGGSSEVQDKRKKRRKKEKNQNFAIVDDEIVTRHGFGRGDHALDEDDEDGPVVVLSAERNSVGEKARKRAASGAWVDVGHRSVDKQGEEDATDKKGNKSETIVLPDASPPRRRQDADDDASPPRRRQDADDDASPPRRKTADNDVSPPRTQGGPDEKLSSGLAAGLITGDQLRVQAQRIRDERERMLREAEAEELGRGAATVYRDQHGRKITKRGPDVAAETQDDTIRVVIDGEERTIGPQGLAAQVEGDPIIVFEQDDEERGARVRQGREAAKHSHDRWGDPMANVLKKDDAPPSVSKFPAPPNRFNIPPGARWDGRDRSNGFETRLIEAEGQRRAKNQQSYEWSVQDM